MTKNVFEGKYVSITYADNLAGTVTITRKSSGEAFRFEGTDIADWIRQMVEQRLGLLFVDSLRRGRS